MKTLLAGASLTAVTLFAMPSMAAVSLNTAPGLPTGPFLADFREAGATSDAQNTTFTSPKFFGSVEVTATDTPNSSNDPVVITQNGFDGIGIDGGESNEIDAINGEETLTVSLPSGLSTVTFGITDLFSNDTDQKPEVGSVNVSQNGSAASSNPFTFEGDGSLAAGAAGSDTGVNNGEQSLIFSGLNAELSSEFEFFVANAGDGEFSVAMVTPLPAAVWMFGAGLAAVSGAAYRRRRAGATPAA